MGFGGKYFNNLKLNNLYTLGNAFIINQKYIILSVKKST